MDSVSKPRCATGRDCYHVRKLRSDKPPTVVRKGDLCEKCREVGYSPEIPNIPRSDPLRLRERRFETLESLGGPKILKSDEGDRIVAFKHDLVLSLFRKRGDFWDEVRNMRERWGVEATAGFPPPDAWFPRPVEDADEARRRSYDRELWGVRDRIVPLRYQKALDWDVFLSICVMYDPPGDGLIGFALQGGPSPKTPLDPNMCLEGPEMIDSIQLSMVAPPVKWLKDPEAVYGMGEQARYKPYIEVNAWTTLDDVKNAFRLIRQVQPQQHGGRPKRDRLVAVQCAVLHDRYDLTYEQIAERHEWEDPSRVGKYVKLGREILSE